MNLDAAHAYHVKANVDGVEKLPEDFFLQPANRYDFVISVMEPKEGDDEHIMIFNKNARREAEGEFTVDPASGVKWMEYFDPHIGEYVPVELKDGMLRDSYQVGEGKLYRLRYDDPPVFETETEPVTEPVTEPTTEPVTEPVTEAATESATEATTEEMTEAKTDSVTQAPAASDSETATEELTVDGGCTSAMNIGAVTVVATVVAFAVRKKKEK